MLQASDGDEQLLAYEDVWRKDATISSVDKLCVSGVGCLELA